MASSNNSGSVLCRPALSGRAHIHFGGRRWSRCATGNAPHRTTAKRCSDYVPGATSNWKAGGRCAIVFRCRARGRRESPRCAKVTQNGNCNASSKLEIIHTQGRASRCDRNTRDGLLVSNGSSARTNSTVSTESTWALVRLDSAATTVPLGYRTIPAFGNEIAIALAGHYAIGIMLACLYIWVTAKMGWRPRQFHCALGYGVCTNALPWLIMFPAMGYGFFGAHGPSGTRLFVSSLCSHAAYGLGLWIAMYLIAAKVFDGDGQPDFKGEAAR